MAGIFGLFDYTKPGPGVSKHEPQKYRFFVFFEIFFRKFWRIIAINALYLLSCLPIITIGPATAGVTYILRNYAREEHAFPWMDYRDTIKKNWLQAFLVSLIDAGLGFFVYVAVAYWYQMFLRSTFMAVPFVFSACVAFLYIFMQFYLYVLLVTFKLNLLQIFKNALLFAFIGLWKNLFLTLILGLFAFALFCFALLPLFLPVLLVYIIVVPGFCGLLINFVVWPVIQKYMVDPYYEQHPEELPKGPEDEIVFEDEGRGPRRS